MCRKCSWWLRKPNDAIFPHSQGHLVWILLKNLKNDSYRSFLAILGLISGPICSQKCSRRLREPNKATFQHSLRYWAWILLEKIKIWLLGSFLGVLDLILGQFRSKNAENILDGLKSQLKPFFHIVRGTDYKFCLKIWKIPLIGPSWPF